MPSTHLSLLLLVFTLPACFPDAPSKTSDATGGLDDTSVVDSETPPDTPAAETDTAEECVGGCGHLDGSCIVGVCEAGTCVARAAADDTDCDDGDACTRHDSCLAGQCVGSDLVTCVASSPCHEVGVCDPTSGVCSNPEKPFDAPCDSGTSYPGFCRDSECRPRMVAISESRTCLLIHGDVRCWIGDVVAKDGPLYTFELPVEEVAVGHEATCVRLSDDTVRCWGSGPVAGGSDAATVTPLPAGRAKSIAVGPDYACIVSVGDQGVRCWGAVKLLDPSGSDTPIAYASTRDLNPVPLLNPAVSVSAGYAHVCAVDTLGKIWCWGSGQLGGLGLGSTTDRPAYYPAGLQSTPNLLQAVASQASTGQNWSCGLSDAGNVRCWGQLPSYGDGRIYGDDELGSLGGDISLGGRIIRLSRNYGRSRHVCAIREDGAVICWGTGVLPLIQFTGYLGYEAGESIGDDEPAVTGGPVDVGEPAAFVAVGGSRFVDGTCAIGVSGKLHCWGAAGYTGYGDGVDRGAVPGTMPPGDVPFE
ncbi:MAG: hypothetical protein KC635_20950 [Myxococcales bacterium]|nr:hypothetical protein [Myxococcales bacterium]